MSILASDLDACAERKIHRVKAPLFRAKT